MTFENKVARYRKLTEHIEELKSIVDSMEGERMMLEADIITDCMKRPAVRFNVFMRKTSSAGLAGREYFTLAFSRRLERTLGPKARLDDQEWLATTVDQRYVKEKLVFQPSAVNAAVAKGELDEDGLKAMDLRYGTAASLTVKRIPNDTELRQIRAEAEAFADETGA